MALAAPSSMPRFKYWILVTKMSSPTNCSRLAQLLGKMHPAVPVVLGQAVFDGDDGVAVGQAPIIFRHGRGVAPGTIPFLEDIFPGGLIEKLRGGGIQGQDHIWPGR